MSKVKMKLLDLKWVIERAQSGSINRKVNRHGKLELSQTYDSKLFKVVIQCEHGRNWEVPRLLKIDSFEELMQEAYLANVEIIEKEIKKKF